jgi:hypothetical protein
MVMDYLKLRKQRFKANNIIIVIVIMNSNTRKDKITAIRIMQQSYCPASVLPIKTLHVLTDKDINKLYTSWIEYKIKIKKLMNKKEFISI